MSSLLTCFDRELYYQTNVPELSVWLCKYMRSYYSTVPYFQQWSVRQGSVIESQLNVNVIFYS